MSSNKPGSIYRTARWKKLRLTVLAEEPTCHWCHNEPSTQVDHVIEIAAGGEPYERSNLVGSCRRCNSIRGAMYGNKKKQQMIREGHAIRSEPQFFCEPDKVPRPLLTSDLSPQSDIQANDGKSDTGHFVPGDIQPRLVTASWGADSYGGAVARWAKDNLQIDLYPWQQDVLTEALAHDDVGEFLHRYSLTSTARQQGKTLMLSALIGWWLTEFRLLRGSPQQVLSVAQLYTTAELIALTLFPVLEERYGFKTYVSSGRMMAQHDDGSWWRIQSASPKSGHGLTVDLLVVDELFAVAELVIDAGLLPTQRARRSPLAVFTSTAGTEDSTALIRWRERGIQQIEKGEPGRIHFAEWSPPPNIDFNDRSFWHMANPSMGLGFLTMQDLEDGFNSPNREAWLRTDLNLWTSAVGSWLPHGTWEGLTTTDEMPAGGVVAIDSDADGVGYVGVRVARRADNKLQTFSEFRVESLDEMWWQAERLAEDRQVLLALTPGLHALCPTELQRRTTIWGQQEMTKYTAIVRSLIMERKILHHDQMSLNEHVNRAVSGRAAGGKLTISSAKSPGSIEQCRCMIAAAGLCAKPSQNIRTPMLGLST